MPGVTVLFEVRAVKVGLQSKLWTWAIYRTGALTPVRKSKPMFATDAEAIEAGGQVITAMQQRAIRSSFGRPGV